MFECFDHVKEMTLVFHDLKLTYANESALVHFKSYSSSICNISIYKIFENESVDKMISKLNNENDFLIFLKEKYKKSIRFKVKSVKDSYNESFIILQSLNKDVNERLDFTRIVTPKSLYDPLMAGKACILNYEIAEPYMELREMINEMIKNKTDENKLKLKETADKLDDFYFKTKSCIDTLVDIESKYEISKSIFNVNEMLLRITKRMNNYFNFKNINGEIIYNSCKYSDPFICGDFFKISKVIITLASELITVALGKNKKATVLLELKKDDSYSYIYIRGVNINITKKAYEDIVLKDFSIANPDKHNPEELTMNIHMVNTYIDLNEGELLIKRNMKSGTDMLIKFPLAKKRYFINERDNEVDFDKGIDCIINLYQYQKEINQFGHNL